MLGHIKKRDVRGGDILFGERIMLVRILSNSEINDVQRACEALECLHNRKFSLYEALRLMDYANEIRDAVEYWLEQEEKECAIEPSVEAKKADVDKLGREVGDMGSVVSLCDRFAMTPAEVYKLPYLDVFTIWKVDAAVARYNRRLEKVREKQYKTK